MSPFPNCLLAVAGVTSLLCLAPAQTAKAQQWYLAWSDEFNSPQGTLPAPSTWGYDAPNAGSGNQEFEVYCGQAGAGQMTPCTNWQQNAMQDGQGNLVISAVGSPVTTPVGTATVWTSARLLTQNTFTFTYGRAEARMKLPVGAGIWPAFWMLGNNIGSVGWPACGEADVMENVPPLGVTTIRSSLHGPVYYGGNALGNNYNFPSGQDVTGYHVYGIIWSPNQVSYYVDDSTHPFTTFTPANVPSGGTWAFNDHPFFLLLNLAVGGSWPGPPDATTPNPAKMYVDYVRVYQNAPVTTNKFSSVSAATYNANAVGSSESVFAGFGQGLGSSTASASSTPLPMILQDTQVILQDSAGNTYPAPLYFVSPNQINFEIPKGIATGQALVSVTSGGNVVSSGTIQIASVAPGLFSANSNGIGPAAAQVLTVSPGGTQTYTLAAQYDPTQKMSVYQPISLGPAGTGVYLILYGTGIRNVSALSNVTATVGGQTVPVLFAGAQGQFAGEDQVNIGPLPQTLAGQGAVNVVITADGSTSNTVQVEVQ